MRRREFIALLSGAAIAWPSLGLTQHAEQIRRVAVLMGLTQDDPEAEPRIAAFKRELQILGWSDRNLRVDFRWSAGDAERARTYATEVVKLAPDAILAHGGETLSVMQQQTSLIPIVFVQVSDPIRAGFVRSLARPEGNITGFTSFEPEMSGKWLEILKEVAPRIGRVLVLQDPTNPAWPGQLRAIDGLASSFAVEIIPTEVRGDRDIRHAIEGLAHEGHDGVLVLPNLISGINRDLIVSLCARYRLPAIYPYGYFTSRGGLVSYGIDIVDLYRRAAGYVDRILRGTKASELPVQAPTKFQLTINLKTAKVLNLTVPETLIARADEVIE